METCMFVCFHVTLGVQITIKRHVSMYSLHLMLTLPPPPPLPPMVKGPRVGILTSTLRFFDAAELTAKLPPDSLEDLICSHRMRSKSLTSNKWVASYPGWIKWHKRHLDYYTK